MELNKDFDCIFVDATLRLRKNWSMVAKNYRSAMTEDDGSLKCPEFLENNMINTLLRSFLQSMRRLSKAYSSNKIVLLWDKSKYHNATILESIYEQDTFKADRTFAQDEVSQKLFHIMGKTKYYIINNYAKFGLPSIMKQGYEADILARIAAEECKLKSALCSIDGDWDYILTPNCPELIHMDRFRIKYYEDIKENCLGEDPWIWNIFYSSFYGSHNNFKQTVSSEYYKEEFETIRELLEKGENLDKVFSEWKLMVAQLQSWNYKSYPDYDEVVDTIKKVINTPATYASKSEFYKDRGGKLLGPDFYDSVIENMTKKFKN